MNDGHYLENIWQNKFWPGGGRRGRERGGEGGRGVGEHEQQQ